MQFIKNGPDIPERLLQDHEEGRIVFFCGAGISYPADLPGFDGLAADLYRHLGVKPNFVQEAALKAQQYDTAIGLLETDHQGGRRAVREALKDILTPVDNSPNVTKTHESLLALSKCHDDKNGKIRLITTNFDRLFQIVIDRNGLKVNTFQAPFLPVPKNRWDGLVYLHGLLPSSLRENELDRLVLSSGDFGLAYLTERWAARFVSELFRYYSVCFVGYSINDPILRYMMDALAADRQRGEFPPEMYAFGDFDKGNEVVCEAKWRAKNVTPILYEKTLDHRYLHETLRSWSETYRDGVRGKELIVLKEAIVNPLIITSEDDFVGRVLWALSDESGLPAQRFAELDLVPSLDWLEPLSKLQYKHDDLSRFGVTPKAERNDNLAFSLINRPAPYDHAPWMALVNAGTTTVVRWDKVMYQLARWLIRHLDDPAFVLWIAKHGGQLHDQFARLVNQRLNELAEFERDGNISELDRIRAAAPCAVPRPMMRTVWRLLLLGRIKSNLPDVDLYPWRGCFKRDGMTPSLRQAFKEFLTPCILLRKPFGRWVGDVGNDDDAQNSREGIIGWELELRADNVHYDLRDLKGSTVWQDALPDLLPDLGLLLRDAFDLMNELGRVNQYCDYSYIHQPSISEHPQNKKFHDWTVLIDLSRDAWLALAAQSPGQANLIALQWLHTPYPLFKRLAYFAATQGTVIPTQVALEWLLFDEGWWLWSVETTCEILRLLVALSSRLEPDDLRRLESAILIGPPRDMFRNDQLLNDLEQIVEREIWLRLAKMDASGAVLGSNAKAELSRLSAKYPQWQLAADERELFPFWMGDGDDLREFIVTPRSRRELVTWLKQYPNTDYARREDDWRQRCRNEFARTACALCSLTRENTWPKDRWREALQAWTEEKLLQRTWRYMAPVLTKAPDDVIQELASSLSQWLMELAKSFEGHQTLFFIFCKRILSMSYKDDVETDEPLMRAINHPVGQVSEALLRWWYRHEPKDNQGLPDEIKSIFSQLCDQHKPVYRHARVLFAAHAITFYRVDPEWTKHNLLPNFEWRASTIEANAAWSGFLGSPRLYRPLFEIIHPAFLETARHYRELGSKGRQYVALLTFAALESRRDPFNVEDLSAAIETLPPEGRLDALRTLVQALDGAGGQRDEYWANRILPYWISIWPKSRGHHSQALSGEVARLCIAAFEVFPKALETLRDWLQPLKDLSIIVYQLEQKGLTKLFPENALAFLDIIVGDESGWLPRDLGKCLKDIREADARLEQDQRFLRLVEKLRQDGGR